MPQTGSPSDPSQLSSTATSELILESELLKSELVGIVNGSGASRRGRKVPGWEEHNLEVVAERSGLNPQFLRRALAGRDNVTLNTLRRVARALGEPVARVVERVEQARRIQFGEEIEE